MNYIKFLGITVLFVLVGLGVVGGCNSGGGGGEDFTEGPPPEEVVNVTAPVLLTPINNDTIQQNNPSIGCPIGPFSGFGFRIFYDWTDSSSPNGIRGYHLFVMNINAMFTVVDIFVEESNFTDTSCNSFVIDSNLNDWIWTVQAEDNLGNLSPVATGEFRFEPCRLDDGTPCSSPATPPVPVANVTTPVLLTPVNNDVIQQNNPNIGCPFDPFRGFGYRVFFDWTDSESPNGIKGYHLLVIQSNAVFPLLDIFVPESEFTFTSCNSFVIDSNLNSWMWSVQAEDNLGNLSPVTEDVFRFEPCRLSNGDFCSAPF